MADEVTIRASLKDDFSRPVKKVRAEIDRTTNSLQRLAVTGTTRAGGGLSNLIRGTNGAGGALRKLDGWLRNTSRTLTATFASSARTGATALGALAAAGTLIGVNTAADFQTAEISLRRMTGSAAEGRALFEFLSELDPIRPFDIGQLNQTATQLASVNIKGQQLRDMIAGVTDIASATSDPTGSLFSITKAIAQMSSAGVILAEDLNQLNDAGVNVGPALQKAFGVGLQQVKGGGYAAQPFIDALIAGSEGAGEEIATKTFRGLLSGVKSRGMQQLVDAFNPLLAILQEQLPGLEQGFGGFVSNVAPALSGLVGKLVPIVSKILDGFGPLLGAIFDGLGRLLDAATPAFGLLGPVVDDLVVAIGEMVTELVPVMPDLVAGFVGLVKLLPAMVRVLTDLIPVVEPMIDLAAAFLSFEPATSIMAGLLVPLLGYSKLMGIARGLFAFARGLTAINIAGAAGGGGGAGKAAGAAATVGSMARGKPGLAARGAGLVKNVGKLTPYGLAIGAGAYVGYELGAPEKGDLLGQGSRVRSWGRSLGLRDDTEEQFQAGLRFKARGGAEGVTARGEETIRAYEAQVAERAASYATTVAPGAIVVNAAAGMSAQQVADMIPPAIESYDRQRAERG